MCTVVGWNSGKVSTDISRGSLAPKNIIAAAITKTRNRACRLSSTIQRILISLRRQAVSRVCSPHACVTWSGPADYLAVPRQREMSRWCCRAPKLCPEHPPLLPNAASGGKKRPMLLTQRVSYLPVAPGAPLRGKGSDLNRPLVATCPGADRYERAVRRQDHDESEECDETASQCRRFCQSIGRGAFDHGSEALPSPPRPAGATLG